MKMFKKSKEKSDVDTILQTLLPVNYHTVGRKKLFLTILKIFQRQMIAQAYQRRFEHEDVVETIRKELHDGPEKELILALLDSPANVDAINLHKAMKVGELMRNPMEFIIFPSPRAWAPPSQSSSRSWLRATTPRSRPSARPTPNSTTPNWRRTWAATPPAVSSESC